MIRKKFRDLLKYYVHFSNKISKSTESLAVFLNAFLFQEFFDDLQLFEGKHFEIGRNDILNH